MKKAIVLLLTLLALTFISCGDEEQSCQHQWDEGNVVQAATDKAVGYKLFTCTLCGDTKSEEIPKLAHTVHTYDKSLWAWDDQSHWMLCDFDDCEATTVKSAHLYSQSYKEENGLVCMVCRSNSTEHSFTDKLNHDENTHWISCDDDGCITKYSIAAHSFDQAGKCTGCNYTKASDK